MATLQASILHMWVRYEPRQEEPSRMLSPVTYTASTACKNCKFRSSTAYQNSSAAKCSAVAGRLGSVCNASKSCPGLVRTWKMLAESPHYQTHLTPPASSPPTDTRGFLAFLAPSSSRRLSRASFVGPRCPQRVGRWSDCVVDWGRLRRS